MKLSALNPRYQCSQSPLILDALTDSVMELAQLASEANMGLNIDAEELDKLDISMDVIERLLTKHSLKDWEGLGVVVQTYGLHAYSMIEWLNALAEKHGRRIMVRLVKGAYWDTEIKHAQVLGVPSYSLFTRKCSTDVSFLACSKRVLDFNNRLYPQFATHNVHSICSIMQMVGTEHKFEFQRLHGMGEEIHRVGMSRYGYPCRIYAPVGSHPELLAYLVRRILENGANSSFVHQIADRDVSVAEIVSDPIDSVMDLGPSIGNPRIGLPPQIFGPNRLNSHGIDLERRAELDSFYVGVGEYATAKWEPQPHATSESDSTEPLEIRNPASLDDVVGTVREVSVNSIDRLMQQAQSGFEAWSNTPVEVRAEAVRKIADLYEQNAHELIALMIRETGKSIPDAVSELREAVDFCRFYANQSSKPELVDNSTARGVITCISPWNFPLAIFTGQITAALSAGNAVIAKPAEQSALTASVAVQMMHQAGVPENVIQLLPGRGETVGASIVSDHRIDGICFTGSTETASRILGSMITSGKPHSPFIAETGGLNAMIVDSTALPEQAVRDIVASAFQSCGQRCSALRMLYIQKDIEKRFLDMLFGAMDELRVGDPWHMSTDVGPAIDSDAHQALMNYCKTMTAAGHLMHQTPVPNSLNGYFVPPSAFRVSGIEDLGSEVFGPILHIATYESTEISDIIKSINARNYGLTFGLHTRIEGRAELIREKVNVGNVYINRNQIGAVVESQPFGGRGLSGTGPKAGGPFYVARMRDFGRQVGGQPIGVDYPQKDLRPEMDQLCSRRFGWSGESDRLDILKSFLHNHSELIDSIGTCPCQSA